jgi:hypothetical protein
MIFIVLLVSFCKLTFGLAKKLCERRLVLMVYYISFPLLWQVHLDFGFSDVVCQRGVVECGSSDPLVRWQRDDVGVVGLVLFVNRCMYW